MSFEERCQHSAARLAAAETEARRLRAGLERLGLVAPGTEHLPLEANLRNMADTIESASALRLQVDRSALGGKDEIAAVVQDISTITASHVECERMLAEEKLQTAELDAVVNSLAAGLIIYNPAGEIVRANPAAELVLGFEQEDWQQTIKERWLERHAVTLEGDPIPSDDLPAAHALRGEEVRGVVLVFNPKPTRTIWVSASAAPVRGENAEIQGAVVVYADITRLHALEEQRQLYVNAISHDLRMPLTAATGHVQLLQEFIKEAGINGEIRQSLDAVLRSLRRMNAMIKHLVEVARLAGGQLQLERTPIDLATFVPEVLRSFATVLEVRRVAVEIPATLSRVSADEGSLERILTNLLSNALKFSPACNLVLVQARQTDGEVVISVTDQGSGIEPEDLPHVFKQFCEIGRDRRVNEVGLGLFITKQLVEAHGGRVWVENNIGNGTTFSFTLPVA